MIAKRCVNGVSKYLFPFFEKKGEEEDKGGWSEVALEHSCNNWNRELRRVSAMAAASLH